MPAERSPSLAKHSTRGLMDAYLSQLGGDRSGKTKKQGAGPTRVSAPVEPTRQADATRAPSSVPDDLAEMAAAWEGRVAAIEQWRSGVASDDGDSTDSSGPPTPKAYTYLTLARGQSPSVNTELALEAARMFGDYIDLEQCEEE